MARLMKKYRDEVFPQLQKDFGLTNPMQVPKITKITCNIGVGEASRNAKLLDVAMEQLVKITGQLPEMRRARKSIAAFKLREGMPVGARVTLRRERMYEFLDRLISIAVPRIRDFRGLSPKSFDGRGNYTLGLQEQTIFPEINPDAVKQMQGMDITMVTTAETDEEAKALLEGLGFPFRAS